MLTIFSYKIGLPNMCFHICIPNQSLNFSIYLSSFIHKTDFILANLSHFSYDILSIIILPIFTHICNSVVNSCLI